MYFQGRRNTCNTLRCLKQKQKKEWTSSHKIYQAKCFVGVRYQNMIEYALLSLYASDQRDSCGCASPHHFPIFIFPRLSLAIISLQYKLFRTRSGPMDTQSAFFIFLKENVCSGYSLEAALSNVNDSFTLNRLRRRPKACCDEYPQLTHVFFVKYTESV